MTPTIGRIVHFYDPTRPRDASGKGGPFAAIVTDVDPSGESMTIDCTIFPSDYPPVAVPAVPHADDLEAGAPAHCYWTWPPRE